MRPVQVCGPIVVINCPRRFDEAWVAAMSQAFEPILAGDRRYACITETSQVEQLPDARMRRLLAAWMTRPDTMERQKLLNVGSSTVVTNTAMRAVMTALYWLWTPPTPQHAARDVEDALAWSLGRLAEAKTPLGMDEIALRALVRSVTTVPRPSIVPRARP